jgi:hypothetical protein
MDDRYDIVLPERSWSRFERSKILVKLRSQLRESFLLRYARTDRALGVLREVLGK